MNFVHYRVYMVYGKKQYKIFLSPDPTLDLHFLKSKNFSNIAILTPALPLGEAYYLWRELSEPEEREGKRIRSNSSWFTKIFGIGPGSLVSILNKKKKLAQRILLNMKYEKDSSSQENVADVLDLDKLSEASQAVHKALRGRFMLPTELEKLLAEKKYTRTQNLWASLQLLWLQGQLDIIPAVEKMAEGYRCNRCGQSNKLVPVDCIKCGGSTCRVCEACITMGEARSCTPLIACPDAAILSPVRQNYQAQLSFMLTPAQRDAARQVKEFYQEVKGGHKQASGSEACLVWAVCGAGKTEVAFSAIADALNKGEKVLFAIPRRDVVMELEPRLQKAFPGVTIACLYGGSEDKYKEGQITIATTHQAIRFYRKFSLIVLDEADAYPYQGSQMLYHFVQRAKQPLGKIVYMTATPSKELLAQIDKGKLRQVTIPARHHGFPLPEPKFLAAPGLDGNNLSSIKLPVEVLQWLHKVVEGDKGQVFIFVPTIKLAEAMAQSLTEGLSAPPFSFPPKWIQFSHSKDPKRDEKRQLFKAGSFPLFVTTSIMERGITLPRAKVMVLFADYERIMDQGTLVQMAGRSGRLEADPIGEVLFVGRKQTTEIQAAIKVIKKMNKEAREKGYLYVE